MRKYDKATVMPWISLVARLVMGGVLLVAGILKVGKPLSNARSVQAYEIFPFDMAAMIGLALPVVEITVGALLVLGLFTRLSAIVSSLMMLAFIIGIASAWARGLSIDCGCFGEGGWVKPEDVNYLPRILEDIGFLICGVWASVFPKSKFAVDNKL